MNKPLTLKQRNRLNLIAKLVAFQVADAPNTVRRGLAVMAATPELRSECEPVFGVSFEELAAGLEEAGMLDVEFQPEPIFA